jgi:hypothetical protein
MMFSRSIAAFLLALIVVFASPPISAQIFEEREYKGETVYCVRTGLHSFSESCSADAGDKYVFIGSVLSVSDLPNNEMRVRLAAEEIFFGDPGNEVVATTSQGRCLGELHPGDRWLFYLREEQNSKKLLLAYGSPSSPVAEAQKSIARLRRLAQMPQSGLIMGNVSQSVWNDVEKLQTPLSPAKHKIIARRKDTGAEYTALTDEKGDYEFEPLPSGFYEVTSNTDPQWWAWEGLTRVRPSSCSRVSFELTPDGSISGRVRTTGGGLDKIVWVAAVAAGEGESESYSAFADRDGHFEFHGLRPGRYLIGIGINAEAGTSEWNHHVYYPGVRQKELAIIVEIGPAEHLRNIDFSIPSH